MTADERIASEAGLTLTHTNTGSSRNTLSVDSTLALCDGDVQLALRAALVRVSSHSFVAVALVWEAICAVAVDSTAGGAKGREDGRHAEEVAVSHKAFPAETLARFAVTGSIEAT